MKNLALLKVLFPLTNQGAAFVNAQLSGGPHKWSLEDCELNNPPAAQLWRKLALLTKEERNLFGDLLPAAVAKKEAFEAAKSVWDRARAELNIALLSAAEREKMYADGQAAADEVEEEERNGATKTLPRGWTREGGHDYNQFGNPVN